jgi:hypothetical protein
LLKQVVNEEHIARELRTITVFGARHGRFGGVFMLPKKVQDRHFPNFQNLKNEEVN